MFGRIKKTIQRRTTQELDDDSNENGSSRRKGNRYASEQDAGYHAKLTDLAGFDACVEACDALTASSSLAQSGAIDSKSGIRDCSITCSPDGDLVLLPHNQTEGEGDATRAELNTIETESRLSSHINTGDSGSIVMGNDLTPDRILNGFSTLGWSAAASSLAIRQTELTSRNTVSTFIQALRNVKRRAIEDRAMACMQLRQATGIGGIAIPSIPPTPLPRALRNSSNRKDRKLAQVDLTSLSQTEPMGSSWSNTTTLEIGSHRVGPLLYAGGTLFSALVSLETYHSRPQDHYHLLKLENILQALNQSTEETAERAYHREKTLNDMQTKVVEMEAAVKYAKDQAVKRWESVHRAEVEATRITESRMLERSRARERLRQEQIQREADLASEENVTFATSAEIWDIVQAATANMEEGDFTPIDFPSAPIGGLRDQSSGGNTAPGNTSEETQTPDSSNTLPIENIMDISAGSAESMPTRAEVEQECNLPQLRAAAMAIEEVIDESSHSLLTVLSALDTTRRAARLSAETNLLQACQTQATTLRQIVKLERANLEERMRSLEALEQAVEQIDVRQDLDLYITADKKERGGSTWMGDDDDGGIASALAVLSSHVQGSTGIGASCIGWDDNMNESNSKEITSEMLEDAIDDLFVEKPDEEYEKTIQLLCKVAADRKLRSQRSSICYALNAKRTAAECLSLAHFNGLCRVFQSILSGCDNESSGVANAKMCMMLSQTFYINDPNADEYENNVSVESSDPSSLLLSPTPERHTKRIYIKSKLTNHDKWKEDEFWDQTLYQCVTESLTHSGVMQNFERSIDQTNSNSEWAERRKLKWHDLNHVERSEAAAQVHAVVFAQLGALAHSMMEFGCGLERSCAFVRRMSVRNQLPISQRSLLLQHLIKSNNSKG
mmetsp:Transcript_2096/g.3081  ORF Transcript_2096/g.3081 Transcript_2096/m.3081 type:complete len:900 (+) Transcript_2096:61-2760(+)